MLNFEEDIKTAGMPLDMMRISSLDEALIMQKLAVQMEDIEQVAPAVQAKTSGRIRVEDKRIINCKADVNQLVPFQPLDAAGSEHDRRYRAVEKRQTERRRTLAGQTQSGIFYHCG
jgi:hypothetical protein